MMPPVAAALEESLRTPRLDELNRMCEQLASTDQKDTNGIASLLLGMSLRYYADVLRQAQQSFWVALGAAVVGILFFLYAAWNQMSAGQARVGIITGSLVEVVSAIGFYLYGRAAHQFGTFHICLERTNRFLIANSVCEGLAPPNRDEARRALVETMASAPLLTPDVISGNQPRRRSRREPEVATVDESRGAGTRTA